MRNLLVAAIMAVFILVVAAPVYPHWEDRRGEAVSVEVASENGSAFLNFPHRDLWKNGTHVIKKYLEARKGENYGIVIRNMTPDRIGVVIAVDGRNIISGRKSDLKNNEEMYILNGYEQTRYNGWRTAGDTVHKFYFTDTADSYAARTFEDSTSMGIIAVAVYREKERPPLPLYENRLQKNAPAAPSAARSAGRMSESAKDESAGTGFGDEQYSPVIKVAFEPEGNPLQKTLVKYEWREVLCKKGIVRCTQEPRNRLWDEDSYSPYPPGYRGR